MQIILIPPSGGKILGGVNVCNLIFFFEIELCRTSNLAENYSPQNLYCF